MGTREQPGRTPSLSTKARLVLQGGGRMAPAGWPEEGAARAQESPHPAAPQVGRAQRPQEPETQHRLPSAHIPHTQDTQSVHHARPQPQELAALLLMIHPCPSPAPGRKQSGLGWKEAGPKSLHFRKLAYKVGRSDKVISTDVASCVGVAFYSKVILLKSTH